MNDSLASTLVLCDLDNLLLGEDGNLTQVVRDVLQLFSSRGGRLTVFSQRSVRSILGSVLLAAPALVCGGTMAYHYADGNRVPLCSFAQQQELFTCLPDTPGVGVAVQMQDGTTRVLRMSNALERHLRQEWTPYLLANAADIHPEQVLRVLLYQDSKSVPLISLAEKAIGDRVALLGERIAPDTLVLTPKRISGREMLDTVCTMAQVGAEQVLVLAASQPMLELVQEDGAEPVYRITLPELQEKVQDDSLELQKFTASVTLQTLAHSDNKGKTVESGTVKVPVNETNTADAAEDAQSMDSAESVAPAETAESTAAESAPASVAPVLMRARAALPMATPETAAPDETDAAETAPPKRTETSDAS